MRNTTLTINQSALRHNLSVIKNQLSATYPAKVMTMVKANAYGHGVSYVIAGLADADAFGVACLSEALEVKKTCDILGIKKPIVLIEGVFDENEWLVALKHDFGCVIHNEQQLGFAIKHPADNDRFIHTIWLKYNTGMNRLGFDQEGVIKAANALNDLGYKMILTSHFACADEKDNPMTNKQITRFNTLLGELRHAVSNDIQGSLCNSAGIFTQKDNHHNWVRAGIALYGSSPFAHILSHELGLQPVMIFGAQIMAIQAVKTGEMVGYGGLWTATKSSRIGIISCGYGDGYPRVVADASVGVVVGDKVIRTPIIGRVAMDVMMIDLTNITAEVGTPVILWGADGAPSIDEVATFAGTTGYELMCRTTTRPIRAVKF
ncbi:alanine racemase [Moraxella sp. Pampa]|uniref:alanine racemase n=1 Tax=Moraxella sp. Pampa TaxID=3111978 RepID=UPI002B40E6A6|nr:alanine racemase [Moraxella sp. Pampa]